MTTEPVDDDFFEEDEPLEDILAIMKRAPHGVTRRPVQTWVYGSCVLQSDSIVGTPLFGGREMTRHG